MSFESIRCAVATITGRKNQLTETAMGPDRLSRINRYFESKEDARGPTALKSLGAVDEAGKQTRGAVR